MSKILQDAEEARIMARFKCANRAAYANKRFEDKITSKDVLRALQRFDCKCIYCGKRLHYAHWHLDHFYSRAMGGKNIPSNIAPSCDWCNLMKGALDGYAFLWRCKQIAEQNSIDGVLTENPKAHLPITKVQNHNK